jgi:4-amino-4-deoxy-L-arabinose transferase-like glycosyltransferase
LAAIVALGALLRIAYAIASTPRVLGGDPFFYHELGNLLATGHGYISPTEYHSLHISSPTAEHPPLYPLAVSVVARLGGTSEAEQRLVLSVLFGTALIVAVAHLGRLIASPRVGLVAALLAAISPMVIAADGSGESEAAFGVFVVLALLLSYRVGERPWLFNAGALGVVIGLGTLTRSDGVLLLLLPAVLLARSSAEGRLRQLGVIVLATAVVLAPWVVRNWSAFGRPVLSTNLGTLIGGSNCDLAYYRNTIGTFALCYRPQPRRNEVAWSNDLVSDGLRYADRHRDRVPAVVTVRVLRTWGFWDPVEEAAIYNTPRALQRLSVATFYPLLVLGLAGLLILRRRGYPIAPFVIVFALTSLLAAGSWGTLRFRRPVEVVVLVLAAVTLVDLTERRRNPRRLALGAAVASAGVATILLAAAGLKSLTGARQEWNLSALAGRPAPPKTSCHIVRGRSGAARTRSTYVTRPARCRPRAGGRFTLADDVIRSSTGRRLQMRPLAVRGYVERSTVSKETVTVSGWAANVKRGRLADAVLIFSNDRFVGAVTTTDRRPDVSRVFRKQLTGSGYSINFPRRLAEPGGNRASLRLFGVDGDLVSPLTFDCDQKHPKFGCTT